MSKRALSIAAFGVMALAMADEARAEIVVLKNGRTMSVQSYTTVGDMALMVLRAGGEVTFPSSVVLRVEPDEAPYPVEEPAPAAAAAAVPVTVDRALLVPVETLNARPFADLISAVAASHDMDIRLVHAVIEQESNYQARARSKKGARGLMQLMPATARHYGVRNSYDPRSNLEAGIQHLKDLMSRLDLPAALAAYNAGEATVQRYGGLPPFPETQSYVRNILRRLGR
jgi:soluble lytic murein transglycosylase-like protein